MTSDRRRVVAVTGASSGVGRASVREFARRGDAVALIARGEDGLRGAAEDVRALGGLPLELPLDVADAEAVEAAAGRIEQELGEIDVWVNNAMSSVFAPVHRITAAEFRRVTEVTYLGYVNGTLSALARMRPRDRGTIVQVGSALAYRGIPLQSAYCAAKHAIQGFNESLRAELMHEGSGVRVTMVQMPALNTPQFDTVRTRLPHHPQPVPPIYQPEVAARAIVAAATHPARREWWVGASTAIALLGNAVFPGVGDRYLAHTGFESQQTGEAVADDRPDNLEHPLPGDRGAHGDFDAKSHKRSLQWELTRHRRLAGGALAGAALAGTAALRASAARRAR